MSDPNSKDGSSPHPDADSPPPTPGSGSDAPVDSASPSTPPTTSPASATTASEPEPSPTSSSPSSPSSSDAPAPPTLEQARAFLRNESVRHESQPRKAAFLASKGLTTEQISALLAEEGEQAARETAADEAAPPAPSPASSVVSAEPSSSVPPIVTYPEFLARPPSAPRPPPLVTPDVLLRALYGGAAASALLYGTAKFVLAPMVSALTDARRELHGTAADNLDQLLRRLESVVSVVPDAAKPGAAAAAALSASAAAAGAAGEDEDAATSNDDDDDDSYDDPTEVFHRDIGVQTSLPPSPTLAPKSTGVDASTGGAASSTSATPPAPAPPPPSALQADRLGHLVDSVRSLGESYAGGSGVSAMEEVRTLLDAFRTDVDQLSRPPAYTFGSSYLNLSSSSGYGSSDGTSATSRYVSTTRNEPDDEIRKAKENIRRVKGALLTARTFPAAR